MEEMFEELYRKYYDELFRFLFYMVHSRELAEDLVQEVFIRVFKAYSKFEKRSSEKTWIYTIARNVAIDWFRKQKGLLGTLVHKVELESLQISHELPEEMAIERDEMRKIYACLKQCKLDHQLVIILRFHQDLSILETAKVLGWTEGKVKTTQHRAMKKLKSFIQEAEQGGTMEYQIKRIG
ncbi:sigma-70 family RNA polymerase sigma factor [Niallia oryzisoli]|uniref:RNA polymerase sigma factor n=2 Tax=Niallia oryzisoli TaxID=1737571 RepID=A0ABZ2C7M6_9BACI